MPTEKSFTSVKVDKDVYEKFKKLSVQRRFHLQELVNRSLYLFTTDESFREKIYNYQIPLLSPEGHIAAQSSSIVNSDATVSPVS